MPDIIFKSFKEEEPFDEPAFTARFDGASDGINDIVMESTDRGALNEVHLPTSVVFSDTIERGDESVGWPVTHSSHYTSFANIDLGPPVVILAPAGFVGPMYWNLIQGTGSGGGRQGTIPFNDGKWEAIGEAVAPPDPLEIRFLDGGGGLSPLNFLDPTPDGRLGVTCIYVMLNVEIENIKGFEYDLPYVPGNEVLDPIDAGVAITVQWLGTAAEQEIDWFHTYQTISPADIGVYGSAAPNNIYARLPERKTSRVMSPDKFFGNVPNKWFDLAVRTVIRIEDLERIKTEFGVGSLDGIGGVRGSVSLIATETYPMTTVKIRSANLTVLLLRGDEVT